jgi:hypothetical protein
MTPLLALRAALALLSGGVAATAGAQTTAPQAAAVAPTPTPEPNGSISVPVKTLPARPGAADAVTFSGQATILSRIDFDTDQRKPTVEFLLDLNGVTGVGDKTGTRFVLTTHDIVVQPHKNNQQIEIVFPLPEGLGVPLNRVRTGLANFAINVDLASGAISSASATLTTR